MDRYALIGHPVAHSKSPAIHAAFAAQTGQAMSYERILAPLDGFVDTVRAFINEGGRGMNVTVPFKLEAFALADQLSPRARAAGAVNTLSFGADGIHGDNTDGVGLVRDLVANLDCPLAGRRVLLLGAGGAARGALQPLLDAGPARLHLANRTAAKARELAAHFTQLAGSVAFSAGGFDDIGSDPFDVVINATSASLSAAAPDIPASVYAPGALAYDMMYGIEPTAFLRAALAAGAARTADGVGMLVEQAAESFLIWRGVRPDTAPVLTPLRTPPVVE
ncbi:shikimate dehydrogenase [Denitromonas iodatirespirans]|uniref:Shikimate dehydrogenase (NADP(+)) n=1 Tax=Denitromonas iodatirespirans TaxID=2795389 RepID=A0A944H9N8_DENI1|nr:shikimate dehydrogenase [Denitromonas iodatirespirans]MBT0959722.1 shikimate dehydrogenase [Denitromonas iodatirespirans]